MAWFVDKLGPDQGMPKTFNELKRLQAKGQQGAQPQGARQQSRSAPPQAEADKKKKKGWF